MIVITLLLLLIPVGVAVGLIASLKAHLRHRRAERPLVVEDDNADPREARRAARALEREERRVERDTYLDTLGFPSFYQLVIIFTVASIGGLILETVWMRFTAGIWQHRYGLVWGPFSPLYGAGAVLLTLCLWKLRTRPVWVIFLVSMVLGSLLEQVTGMLLDTVFHATSWSYSHMPDALTKYVSLRMSAIWGLLGWAWCRVCLPEALWLIGEPRRRGELVLVAVLTAFLVLDVLMTVAVTMRKASRDAGIEPSNAIERYIDARYDDHFMRERFENLDFEQARDNGGEGTVADGGMTRRHELPEKSGATQAASSLGDHGASA